MSVHFSSKSELWETPQDLFDELGRDFRFSLDVCATASNTKCLHYFDESQDALSQDWGSHVCWMNPPYGRKIAGFMRKANEAAMAGATVVCLVPARTDTAWWQDYVIQHEVRFIRGRLKFVGAKHSAPFPSAIVVMRPPNSP